MRSKGDYSYINKGLFERVEDDNGNPLEIEYENSKGEMVKQYVYKAINAWGDGQRANEFYNIERNSVIDNGFVKIRLNQAGTKEKVEGISNGEIISLFRGKKYMKVEEQKEDWQNKDNNCPIPF